MKIIIMIKGMFYTSALSLMIAVPAEATLIDRGNGMIYDDELDLTWLQDANYAFTSGYSTDNGGRMTHSAAAAWADQLVYGGFDDWMLPKLSSAKDNSAITFDGVSHDWGYNIVDIDSPLSYMYYVNLGNIGSRDTSGGEIAPELYGLDNVSFANGGDVADMVSFTNLFEWYYWYDDAYVKTGHIDKNWTFKMDSGVQGSQPVNPGTTAQSNAWAVREGDVAVVPVPAALWLFISGLVGLSGLSMRKKNR